MNVFPGLNTFPWLLKLQLLMSCATSLKAMNSELYLTALFSSCSFSLTSPYVESYFTSWKFPTLAICLIIYNML